MITRFNPLLAAIFIYIVSGYLLYFYGPINWEDDNLFLTIIYMLSTTMALTVGWYIGFSSKKNKNKAAIRDDNYFLYFLLSLIYINLKIYLYTGHFFLDVDMSASVFDNYTNTVQYATSRESTKISMVLSIVSALLVYHFWRFLYIGLSLKRKSIAKMMMLVTIIGFLVLFVVAKGGDKEIVDLVVFSVLVLYVNGYSIVRKKNMIILILGFFLVIAVISERKSERMVDYLCINNYCSSEAAVNSFEKAYFVFAGYLTQGYKGLSVALNSEDYPNAGFCVSPMLSNFSIRITGLCNEHGPYVSYINESDLWTSNGNWVSAHTWFANFFSFPGVVILLFFHAILFAYAIKNIKNDKDIMTILFVFYSLIAYIYISANNQIFLSLDSAFIFIISLIYVMQKFLKDCLK